MADLPQIVDNYNKNIHASTGIPPADVLRENKEQMTEITHRDPRDIPKASN